MSKIETFLTKWANDAGEIFLESPQFLADAALAYQANKALFDRLSAEWKHAQYGQAPKREAPRQKLSKNRILAIFRRDGFTCQICGAPGGDLTIDHIKPVSKGGGNEAENLRAACRTCNTKKGDK